MHLIHNPKHLVFSTLLCLQSLYSQDFTHLGLLPRINYTTPIHEKLSFNGTFFSEVDLEENEVGGTIFPSKVLNLTFIAGMGYKLNTKNILTGSYLFRIIDPFEDNSRIEHRFIQQLVHIQYLGSLRLRHHFRAEQRFIQSAVLTNVYNASLRLSYSFGWDLPLQGRHLDVNEFYLNSINSYFVQVSRPRTAFNNLNEFYLGLGYQTKHMGRFEIGPEAKISIRNSSKELNALVFIDIIWYPK
ncbi:MAG: DUF2490 domain-containing protein [Bacteroidota bacterium]